MHKFAYKLTLITNEAKFLVLVVLPCQVFQISLLQLKHFDLPQTFRFLCQTFQKSLLNLSDFFDNLSDFFVNLSDFFVKPLLFLCKTFLISLTNLSDSLTNLSDFFDKPF